MILRILKEVGFVVLVLVLLVLALIELLAGALIQWIEGGDAR